MSTQETVDQMVYLLTESFGPNLARIMLGMDEIGYARAYWSGRISRLREITHKRCSGATCA